MNITTHPDFSNVFLAPSKICHGQGVFAAQAFNKHERILLITGYSVSFEQAMDLSKDGQDKSLQIGHNLYRAPSGNIDDFINHSCEPNSFVHITERYLSLIALRDIQRLEEITFDYLTTMDEDFWQMNCTCGSKQCRGRIRDFKYLPREVQEKYISLGIIPSYVLDGLRQRK